MRERGWQQALESIYPLKFNVVKVLDGDVVYLDEDQSKPLHISHVMLRPPTSATSSPRTGSTPRPSTATAWSSTPAAACWTAMPTSCPSLTGRSRVLQGIQCAAGQAAPVERQGEPVAQGRQSSPPTASSSTARGTRRYGSPMVAVRGLDLDYIHATATAAAEKTREKGWDRVAGRWVARNPSPPVAHPHQAPAAHPQARVGVLNQVPGHSFHLFVDDGELDVTNISPGFGNGPTQARLTGRFMGSGKAHGQCHLPRRRQERSELQLPPRRRAREPAGAQRSPALLRQARRRRRHLLRLLGGQGPRRPHRRLPQAALRRHPGLRSQAGQEQAGAQEALTRRSWAASPTCWENHRGEDATVADLSGPLSAPHTSTWEVVSNLVKNAFREGHHAGIQERGR